MVKSYSRKNIEMINLQFLGATKHLYNWPCLLVGRSAGRSVTHSFDDQHVAPYWPTWPCFFTNLDRLL